MSQHVTEREKEWYYGKDKGDKDVMDGWLAELSKYYKRNSAWWHNIHYPVYLRGVLPTTRGPL